MSDLFKGGYLNPASLSSRINERIADTKKVSKVLHNIKDIEYALSLIDCINQEPEYAVSYEGVRFEDIRVPKFLSDFIWPSKVSFKPELKYPDLRRVHSVDNKVPVDLRSLKRLCDNVNAEMKCDAPSVSIDQYRRPKTIDEVKFSVTHDKVERTMSEGSNDFFVPVPVISAVMDIVGEHVVNEDAEYIVNMYLDYLRFD